MHVHFHVIPKSSEFGLRKQWTPRPLADGEAEEILRIMQASVGQE
jgi:diadenosine tetraphosphate (Ap4A) HIT family hydrolase